MTNLLTNPLTNVVLVGWVGRFLPETSSESVDRFLVFGF
jgi:hypothetical protein